MTGCGVYFQFLPRATAGYTFPLGFMQNFVKSGGFDSNANRLRFRFQCSKNVVRRADGGDMIQVGTYVKTPTNPDPSTQGAHYYHLLATNVYAGRWVTVELNRVPQHRVGMDPNTNWPEDPEYVAPSTGNSPVHYFNGLTRFYFDTQSGNTGINDFSNETCSFADFQLATVNGEPDAYVSSVASTYNGSAYEVTWRAPKNVVTTYDVRYSTTSFASTGFSGGTAAGQVSSNGSTYAGVAWTSPKMPEAKSLYVAIRPVGQTAFKEVAVVQPATKAFSQCDVNQDGAVNAVDVQMAAQAALGNASCVADLNGDGACNIVDLQRVINAALGGSCRTGR